MNTHTNKEFRKLIRRAEHAGWTYEHSGKHGKLWHPDGKQFVSVSASPSDQNAHKILERQMRRIGFKDYEKERKVTEEPTSNVGEALLAAKAVEERKQDHTASGAARRYLRENADKSHSAEDITMVVTSRVPSANKLSVSQALVQMAAKGEAVRVGRGIYKWAGEGSRPTTPTVVAEAPKVTIGALTGDASLDEDLMLVDQALVALGEIEAVVRRVHEKIAKLAELKRMLG